MKGIATLDRKAPRVKKSNTALHNRSLWCRFRKAYPEYRGMSDSELNKVLSGAHEKFTDYAATHREGVELPNRIGIIGVVCCQRPKKPGIDYTKSTPDRIVYHRNYETDGHIPKIVFVNNLTKYKFFMSGSWVFTSARKFSQKTSVAFKADYTKYAKVAQKQYVNSLWQDVDESGNKIKYVDRKVETIDDILNIEP